MLMETGTPGPPGFTLVGSFEMKTFQPAGSTRRQPLLVNIWRKN
jgi:hypothetical protein